MSPTPPVTSIWGYPERESSVRIAAAIYNVKRHAVETCQACPPDDSQVCEVFRCSVRRLVRHAGLPGLFRAL